MRHYFRKAHKKEKPKRKLRTCELCGRTGDIMKFKGHIIVQKGNNVLLHDTTKLSLCINCSKKMSQYL